MTSQAGGERIVARLEHRMLGSGDAGLQSSSDAKILGPFKVPHLLKNVSRDIVQLATVPQCVSKL